MDKINAHIVSTMLDDLSKYSDFIQDGYAIAIYTAEGNVYTYKAEMNIEDENELIYNDIKTNLNNTIQYIICVRGKKMTIDIPPYHLRQKLCEINEKNYEAEIVIQGMNGLHFKKMKNTLL